MRAVCIGVSYGHNNGVFMSYHLQTARINLISCRTAGQ